MRDHTAFGEKGDGSPAEPFVPSLWTCLRHPCRQIQAFDAMQSMGIYVPPTTWSYLTGIAVGGSTLYGASLCLLFPQWLPTRSALWFALSAGLSWCIFGPFLALLTHRSLFTCAHACLITMAYGEGVLLAGAGANVVLKLKPELHGIAPSQWNFALVGVSNLVMAITLATQLRTLGIPSWRTLLSWMLVLNGSGVLLFSLLRRILQGKN